MKSAQTPHERIQEIDKGIDTHIHGCPICRVDLKYRTNILENRDNVCCNELFLWLKRKDDVVETLAWACEEIRNHLSCKQGGCPDGKEMYCTICMARDTLLLEVFTLEKCQ